MSTFSFKNYINGKWIDSMDHYIDDHFPFRAGFISSSAYFHQAKGFQLKNAERVVVLKKKPKVLPNQSDSSKNKLAYPFTLEP